MSDVFVSYASEDRERARTVASSLEACGWSVWWDRKIIAGQSFDRIIEHELDAAKCVIVLWSKDSISSDWVKNEAAVASERRVLVPALLDRVKLPLEFRRKQAADLVGWNGNPSHAGFQALCEGVAAATEVARATPHPAARPTLPVRLSRRATFGLIGAITVALALIAHRGFVRAPEQDDVPHRADNVQRMPRIKTVTSETHAITNPRSVELGAIYKVTLARNEESYFKLSSPVKSFEIVLDVRRADNNQGNLQGTLSFLDEDSVVVPQRGIQFNEIDVGHRKTAMFSAKSPAAFGFKLLNQNATSNYYLTVVNAPSSQLIPFFAEVIPKPLALGRVATGALDVREFAYYITSLPQGDYKMVLDFSTATRERTNIQGYLAILNSDGGNQTKVIGFNEVDVSSRKSAVISLKKDESRIIRIQNSGTGIKYALELKQNAPN